MTRDQFCENCLNAYNSPHCADVLCWNKEFQAQFWKVDITVRPGETCGTWQRREENQPKLVFSKSLQLKLNFN